MDSKREKMLFYLKNIGDLSTMDAIRVLGSTRPANIVGELRKNHKIITIMKQRVNHLGIRTQYGVYHYVAPLDPVSGEIARG